MGRIEQKPDGGTFTFPDETPPITNDGPVFPWHLITQEHCDDDTASQRYNMCLDCPHLIKFSKQCSKCGCFMKAKVHILRASCPIGKW